MDKGKPDLLIDDTRFTKNVDVNDIRLLLKNLFTETIRLSYLYRQQGKLEDICSDNRNFTLNFVNTKSHCYSM